MAMECFGQSFYKILHFSLQLLWAQCHQPAVINKSNSQQSEGYAQTGTLQCNISFMQLKKIKRSSERRAAETV